MVTVDIEGTISSALRCTEGGKQRRAESGKNFVFNVYIPDSKKHKTKGMTVFFVIVLSNLGRATSDLVFLLWQQWCVLK